MARASRRIAVFIIAGVSAGVLAGAAAHGEDLPLTTRIDHVTLHPDAALVTRMGTLAVPAGRHRLAIDGLPEGVDLDALRVEGVAEGGVRILDLESALVPGPVGGTDDRRAERRTLERRLVAERGAREAAEARKQAVLGFARGAERGLDGERALAPADWAAAWALIDTGVAEANARLAAHAEAIARLEEEIAALDAAGGAEPGGRPLRRILVSVEAARAGPTTLRLTYPVAGASWRPVYEARLDTRAEDGPTLTLVRQAVIAQTTGEPWPDVTLSLSTVAVMRRTEAPEAPTVSVSLFDRDRAWPSPAAPAPRLRDGVVERGAMAEALAAPAPPPIETAIAVVDVGAYQARFDAPSRVDVPADGGEKRIALGESVIKPRLMHRAVPAVDPTAYLEAGFTHEGPEPILPGRITLHRDGALIGRSEIGFLAPGAEGGIGFGADDEVRIERVPLRKRENEPRANGTKIETIDHRTDVTNRHAFPVRVELVERLPVSENGALTVEPLPTNTKPTTATLDHRRGVSGYSLALAPGATEAVRFGWRLRYPADRELAWSEADPR